MNLPHFIKYHLALIPMEKILPVAYYCLNFLPPVIVETFRYKDQNHKS